MREVVDKITVGTGWLPQWMDAVILLAAGALAGLLVWRLLFEVLIRLFRRDDLLRRSILTRTRRPAQLGLMAAGLGLGISVAPVAPDRSADLRHLLLVCFILLVAWMLRIALDIWGTIHMRRFSLDSEDNLLARKHVTQMRILIRVANILIVVIGIATALMTFDAVRQYGVSLLASAGAAGIVAGLALQPLLKNIFAGIQLAVTQPIRIDDAVIVEGEWGNVEEITSTYVVIRIWDWRRLIVPLGYFIERPFQNWTREDSRLIGVVLLYLDHSAPVGRMREKAREIAGRTALWDGAVFNLAVTDFRERVMEVRVLVSARSAGEAFDLRCEMRERLIEWIQSEIPHALPRTRENLNIEDAQGLLRGSGMPKDSDAAT
jgi:small-conductance mechanosensitive channel